MLVSAFGAAIAGFTQGGWRPAWGGLLGGGLGFAASAMLTVYLGDRSGQAEIARRRREIFLPAVLPGDGTPPAVSKLLDPRRRITPFRYRGRELRSLQAWLSDREGAICALLTGEAHTGKSRLAVELAATSTDSWDAVFARRQLDGIFSALDSKSPLLVIVEISQMTSEGLEDLLSLLQAGDAREVRYVLVVRNRAWLDRVASRVPGASANLQAAFAIHLTQGATIDDSERWFSEFRNHFALLLGGVTHGVGTTRLLEIQPIGDLVLDALVDAAPSTTSLEELYLNELIELPALAMTDRELEARVLTSLIIRSPANLAQLTQAIRKVPELADASGERLREISTWAMSLYVENERPYEPPWSELVTTLLVRELKDEGLMASVLEDLKLRQLVAILISLVDARVRAEDSRLLAAKIAGKVINEDFAQALLEQTLDVRDTDSVDTFFCELFARRNLALPAADPVELLDVLPQVGLQLTRSAYLQLAEQAPTAERAERSHAYAIALLVNDHLNDAERMFREASRLFAEAQMPEDEADSMANWGAALLALGKNKEAEVVVRRAIAISRDIEAASGSNLATRDRLAYSLESLGAVLEDRGEREALRDIAQEILRIRRNDSDTFTGSIKLARALFIQSRVANAEDLTSSVEMNEALSIAESCHAARPYDEAINLQLAEILDSMGLAYIKRGRFEYGADLLRRADALLLNAIEPVAQLVQASVVLNLCESGDPRVSSAEKVSLLRRAVGLLSEATITFPENAVDLADAMGRLGRELCERTRRVEGIGWYRKAIAILREQSDASEVESQMCSIRVNLATALSGQPAHAAEADRMMEDAIEVLERRFVRGESDEAPVLATAWHNWAGSQVERGQYDDALASYRKSLKFWELEEIASSKMSADKIEHGVNHIRHVLRILGRDYEAMTFRL